MVKNYTGLDILRGFGIFCVVFLHTAFYNFDGIWDIDFENPPAVITVIGLVLMSAGLFAMISGFAHTARFTARVRAGVQAAGKILASRIVAGLFVLAVAYAYFIFTGPGIANFASRAMNNSILVELVRNGRFPGFSPERLLYVDSLVMIGLNVILVGLALALVFRITNGKMIPPSIFLTAAVSVFLLSLIRLPLYDIYGNAVRNGHLALTLSLNWLVNKNNPILPFFAFGLFGAWAGLTFDKNGPKGFGRIAPVASFFLVAGAGLYVFVPDTMLRRSIDLKWYAIMTAQVGLFLFLLALAVRFFDLRRNPAPRKPSLLSRFFCRFGTAGLSVFFLESLVSAAVFRVIRTVNPGIVLGLAESLAAGFAFAVAWGLVLVLWEKTGYRFGLEYWYCAVMKIAGGSAKAGKLEAGHKQ